MNVTPLANFSDIENARTLSEGLASETIRSDFWEGSPKRQFCVAGNIFF